MAGYIGKGKAQSLTDVPDVIGHDIAIDRQYSDGDIISLRKDGTTVGSIGSRAGLVSTIILDPRSGQGAGLTGAGSQIVPVDETGIIIDNDINLGQVGGGFKDLYLSGGVYLGGTGSANHLDDYEEGTWTPNAAYSSVDNGCTYAVTTGSYTKIGRQVTLYGHLNVSNSNGSSGSVRISNLPFTVADTIALTSFGGGGECLYFASLAASVSSLVLWATDAQTYAEIRYVAAGGATAVANASDAIMGASWAVRFALTYNTTV